MKIAGYQKIPEDIDGANILEVLKDPNNLLPDVKKFIDENNQITEQYFSNIKNLQNEIFKEIKGRIKLDDESLKFKDKKFFYWSKTDSKSHRKNDRKMWRPGWVHQRAGNGDGWILGPPN